MAELKTQANQANVADFLNALTPDLRRQDCLDLCALMEQLSQQKPVMWGNSIVGFGAYHYRYESGREGDWFPIGFSPRKNDLTLYLLSGLEVVAGLLPQLGKHKIGKCCLYIKRLADIDRDALTTIIRRSLQHTPMGKQ
jgi:hypothetical protein